MNVVVCNETEIKMDYTACYESVNSNLATASGTA